MSRVARCMCEDCYYNENLECRADGVEVHSSPGKKVESSDGTWCNTFKPKGNGC